MKKLRVFVYGAGRVGRSIARAIEHCEPHHNVEINGAWNRSFARAFETSRILNVETFAGDSIPEPLRQADVILLSVLDDTVVTTASLLARHIGARQVLLHTSGSLGGDAMQTPLLKAHQGSCHPLQALASSQGDPERLKGATFAIDGDEQAQKAALRIAQASGGKPLVLAPGQKALYHAAAVIAANYTTVLMDAARTLMEQAGVDAATSNEILLPLLTGTLHHIEHHTQQQREVYTDDPNKAGHQALALSLTGPVRRGDTKTVRRHLKKLDALAKREESFADLPELYRLLARRGLALARHAELSSDAADSLEKALRSPKPSH